MSTKHMSEPWLLNMSEHDADSHHVSMRAYGGSCEVGSLSALKRADRERVVSCVNGCKDIRDPETQVPEILAALKDIFSVITVDADGGFHCYKEGNGQAQEAIMLRAKAAFDRL